MCSCFISAFPRTRQLKIMIKNSEKFETQIKIWVFVDFYVVIHTRCPTQSISMALSHRLHICQRRLWISENVIRPSELHWRSPKSKNPLRQEFQLGGPTSPITPLFKNRKSNGPCTLYTPSFIQHNVSAGHFCLHKFVSG
jgi:hypothetical protein